MTELLLLKYAHIIAFVYWLGGDLGTFVASKQVVNPNNSPDSRAIALKIMLACDQGPKLAMPLILPLGMHMAVIMGMANIPGWSVVAMWLIALYWFTTVMVLYVHEHRPFTAKLSRIDFYFRIGIVIALVTFALNGLLRQGMAESILTEWASYKILIFAAMVTCGIFIRLNLKPFIPAFVTMMQSGPTEATNNAMKMSVQRSRPFVWLIWAGLFINAAYGVHLL